MDSMIIFGDMELLQRYINHNAIEYNVAHLMRACATLNIELVHEITNNKVLPNKECVDALLSNLPDPIIECYNCHNAKHSAKNKRDIAAQQQKYGIIRNIMMMCIRCGYHVTGDNIDAMKKHGIDMHVCNKVSD